MISKIIGVTTLLMRGSKYAAYGSGYFGDQTFLFTVVLVKIMTLALIVALEGFELRKFLIFFCFGPCRLSYLFLVETKSCKLLFLVR